MAKLPRAPQPTEYQGVELPPLPEPCVWGHWKGATPGASIRDTGVLVGAIAEYGGRHLVQALPKNKVGSGVREISTYVNTPQEAVPLLVSYVLLGITKETP